MLVVFMVCSSLSPHPPKEEQQHPLLFLKINMTSLILFYFFKSAYLEAANRPQFGKTQSSEKKENVSRIAVTFCLLERIFIDLSFCFFFLCCFWCYFAGWFFFLSEELAILCNLGSLAIQCKKRKLKIL